MSLESWNTENYFKDGAYLCYCAYVLRILRYSDFLWVTLITCIITLIQGYSCAVEDYGEKAEQSKCSWYPKRKLGVTMHFLEKSKLQFGNEHHTLLCILKVFTKIVD